MTAKEYLNQAYLLDQRVDSKLNVLSRLKDTADRTTGVMDGEAVSHTRNPHSLQDTVAKIIDLQNEINKDIDRLIDLKREVTGIINLVRDPSCQIVLEYRYLCYHSWEEIAVEMKLNIRSVYRLHGQALKEVDGILKAEKKIPFCQ